MPMSKDEQARKGKELLAEAVPYLLQSDHDEDDIGFLIQDLVADWNEAQEAQVLDAIELDREPDWRSVPVRSRTSD